MKIPELEKYVGQLVKVALDGTEPYHGVLSRGLGPYTIYGYGEPLELEPGSSVVIYTRDHNVIDLSKL